jgi:ribosomal protein S18 acetylase RimI-like enzyme
MEYILRPATPADLRAVATWVQTAEQLRLWAGPALTFPPVADITWHEIGATDKNSFSLVDSGGNIVGFGQLLVREPNRVHFARIIVSSTIRGKGLGRVLCQELIRVGIERCQPAAFTLNVYRDNVPAFNLYKSLGFIVVSVDLENNWYGMRLQLHPEQA